MCQIQLAAAPTKHDVASEAKDTQVTPETPRSAFGKGEKARVLQEMLQDSPESNYIALQDEINTSEDDGANATSARMDFGFIYGKMGHFLYLSIIISYTYKETFRTWMDRN